MRIFDLFKKKSLRPMVPTEWYLETKDGHDRYDFQNDFIDAENRHCAFESLSAFGWNANDILRSESIIFKMLEFDDRVVYCAGINDHRVELSGGRAVSSILGVVLDKRSAQNYKFEDFKSEIEKKNTNIVQKYPTVFDLAFQLPIKFCVWVRPVTYDKNIPNRRIPQFKNGYYPDAPGQEIIK